MTPEAESTTSRALRITVLAGGPGAERAVSLDSGAAVAAALRSRGHTVFVADIGPADLAALDHSADVVFPALHGLFGEDGQLQEILESRGIPFVGSGAAASKLAIDKVATKQRAIALGIATPTFAVLHRSGVDGPMPAAPCVLKPPAEGSSVDALIAWSNADRDSAAQQLLSRHERILVESFVAGTEITVGIVDHAPLPPIRIVPKREFYNYDAKYEATDTEYRFDTGVRGETGERLMVQSAALFRDLDCRHLARVDWIVDAADTPWLLEINTLPGFTSHSLLPKAAAHAGIPFEDLVERLVRLAVKDQ